jgi:DNA topoisomerase-1
VRRFLATFSPPMITESTRADIEAGSETYFVRGKVVLDPGYAGIYTYARSADEEIPALEEGQQLALDGKPWLVDKETQPPARLSEAKLVQLMDEQGLGTKATRPDIIQKLYSRKYVRNHPPEPTATGMAMYEAFKEYVPEMATSEMTASLEAEMDQIARSEMEKDSVVDDSRKLVHQTFKELLEGEEALSKMIWAGMDQDRILGPCMVCHDLGRVKEDGSPNMLRIIRAKKSGKSFVGCSGWEADNPDACDQTFPMPQPNFYEVTPLEENCSICHRTPRVNVKTRGRAGRPWKLCFNDDCPTMIEMREKRAERQAAQAAAKAAKEADEKAGKKAKPKAKSGAKKKAGSKAKPRTRTVAASKSGGGRSSSGPDLGTRRVKRAGSRGKPGTSKG